MVAFNECASNGRVSNDAFDVLVHNGPLSSLYFFFINLMSIIDTKMPKEVLQMKLWCNISINLLKKNLIVDRFYVRLRSRQICVNNASHHAVSSSRSVTTCVFNHHRKTWSTSSRLTIWMRPSKRRSINVGSSASPLTRMVAGMSNRQMAARWSSTTRTLTPVGQSRRLLNKHRLHTESGTGIDGMKESCLSCPLNYSCHHFDVFFTDLMQLDIAESAVNSGKFLSIEAWCRC